MKKRLILVALVPLLLPIFAHGADGDLGVGVILGEPTGLTAKLYLSSNDAVDLAASWSFRSELIYLHADYIRHFPKALGRDLEPLVLYAGIGGLVQLSNNPVVGARFPVGINFFLDDAPFEFFLELGPALLIVPETDFDFTGGIGVRYYF